MPTTQTASVDATRRLRTPLQDILSYARRLLETTSLADARLLGEHLQATASALLAVVDGLAARTPPADDPAPEAPAKDRPKPSRAGR